MIASIAVTLFAGCTTIETPKNMALFNGTNLDNWVVENDGQFLVEDGVLKVNRGTGWLRSADVFSDFTLLMEFRFLEAEERTHLMRLCGRDAVQVRPSRC